MKTTMIIMASAIFFLSSLASCQECTVCEKGSEPDVRICKSDFDKDSQYRDAIQAKEADNYSCHN